MATFSGGSSSISSLNWELHFLIAKFLSDGPCQESSKVLVDELEKYKLIPERTDWLGQSTVQDFQSFNSKYDHIKPDHLPKLLEKLLIDKNSSITPEGSKIICPFKSLLSINAAVNGTLQEPLLRHPLRNALSSFSRKPRAFLHRETFGVPITYTVNDADLFSRLSLQCSSLGHLTAVYCVLYDITGKYIFTGADDNLVKVWSAVDGRLLATLRGNSAEITDLAVNKENTLLASSSCDRYIRVWCLATGAPVATLSGHTTNVTSVFFCPIPRSRSKIRYLASTSTDGSVAFHAYTEDPRKQSYAQFQPKPTLYLERMRPGSAQMICSSFSPGGVFMAAGSADNNVRVYYMLDPEGPKRILEVETHKDRVDSISWAHRGVRFISGAKDGMALVWRYDCGERWLFQRIEAWKPLPGDPRGCESIDIKFRHRVTMVAWNADDSLVLTAVSNHTVKVWNPDSGALVRVLRDHSDEVYVIEPHPIYPRVVCTAGHDGKIFVWDIGNPANLDINSGRNVFEYKNILEEGQGHGAVFDVKWSPDGLSLAATDSHGHLLMFSCANNEKFQRLPKELFFHTDYRPLTTDAMTNTVLDEQTQVLPHLMPPPFLVNMDGAPYPATLQRLVPGRENCKDEQLIPNVAVADGGAQEVIEGLPAPLPVLLANNVRSNIDQMIEQLAAAQGVNVNGNEDLRTPDQRRESNLPPNERRGIAHRRSGDIEGVRQSRGNWQTGGFYGTKRTIIPPLSTSLLRRSEETRYAHGREEENYYLERRVITASPITGTSALISPAEGTSKDFRSRRLHRLAAQAAERRRQEEVDRQNEQEGIPRPNPPQQEISVPQVSPRRMNDPRRGPERRHTTRRGGVFGGGGNRTRRSIRFATRRDSDPERIGQNTSGESQDSSFSSSDVSEATSSESEFTDSDWGGGGGGTGTGQKSTNSPKKNGVTNSMANEGRRRTTRKTSGSSKENEANGSDNNSDEDFEDPRPGPSSQPARQIKHEPKSRPIRQQRKVVDDGQLLDGISPLFRPSEWFATQKPCKFPYWPQIGDELVYFRQGHETYVKTVMETKVYEISKKALKSFPWVSNPKMEAQICCRVISVKFEIKPPRLVLLKLAVVDWDTGEHTGTHINVSYHDMKNVVDFLILRQLYDKSMRHNWSVKDRIRCLIGNTWWLGTITAVHPHVLDFPHSKFLLYKVRWDNDDFETLSPWDIEVIPDAFDVPDDAKDNGIQATDEDIRAGLYEVKATDWPPYGHQDAECDRISSTLSQVMELGIAEPFLTPVDLNLYSDYAYHISYPMDLSTIKARLDNRFYRRIDAVKFDIKFIAINTEIYNVSKSEIVKKSRIIKDLCIQICEHANVDVNSQYHRLQRDFTWLSTDIDEDERRKKGRQRAAAVKTEPVPGTSRTSTRLREKEVQPKSRRSRGTRENDESTRPWDERCRDLLNKLWHCRDAAPFREPVDPTEYPEYYQQIDTPMDLQSIKEDLLGGNYSTPLQFSKDVQLIFSNSKQFNTDKHSTIHLMTIRLKSMFDCQIRPILEDWKRLKTKASRNLKGSSAGSPTKSRMNTRGKCGYKGTFGGDDISSPRKNPRRSAAIRNPYVHKGESSGEDIFEDSSEEEFVADQEEYHDRRKTKRRRRSSQQSIATTPPRVGRVTRGRTRNTCDSHPVIKEESDEVEEEPEEEAEEEVEEAEEGDEEAEGEEAGGTSEEDNLEPEENTDFRGGRNLRTRRDTGTSDRRSSNENIGAVRNQRVSGNNSRRRSSVVLGQNGRCNNGIPSSPRKNPKRSAASRNPYVHYPPSSHDGEEGNTTSEEEFVPDAEHEVTRKRGQKRRQSEAASISQNSQSSPSSPRRSRRRLRFPMTNGHRPGRDPTSPEPHVRRSSRIRPMKRRRIMSDDDDDDFEEKGPTTRNRGRPNRNYEEDSHSSDETTDW